MSPGQIVTENEVLIAAALWLHARGVLPLQCSVATGQGIDARACVELLRGQLGAAGVPNDLLSLASSGPDCVGISLREFWQLECKGAGAGPQSTQRNNFDRALASVVLYYTAILSTPDAFAALRGAVPHLGLALPATLDYLRELRRRVPLAAPSEAEPLGSAIRTRAQEHPRRNTRRGHLRRAVQHV